MESSWHFLDVTRSGSASTLKLIFLEIVDDRPDFTFKATAALDATIYLFEDLEFKKLSERIQKKIKPKTCFFQICFLSEF